MFIDVNFQQQLRLCYADPRIWKGINVVMHETQLNRWASKKPYSKSVTNCIPEEILGIARELPEGSSRCGEPSSCSRQTCLRPRARQIAATVE